MIFLNFAVRFRCCPQPAAKKVGYFTVIVASAAEPRENYATEAPSGQAVDRGNSSHYYNKDMVRETSAATKSDNNYDYVC